MIHKCDDWPLVLSDDDGIRPAGKPDECFYCSKKVGSRHGPKCVCVLQYVQSEVVVEGVTVGYFKEYIPYHWDAHDIEFHLNGSSWCCDNALAAIEWLDVKESKEAQAYIDDLEDDNCTCHYLNFEFDKVVDHGPFVILKNNPPSDITFTEKEVRP